MRALFFAIIFIGYSNFISVSHAQTDDDWRLYKPKAEKKESKIAKDADRESFQITSTGKVEIIADSRIKNLNARKKEYPTLQDGYRVQIFFGNRDVARQKEREFKQRYSKQEAYISYLAPNFRLRVGDFRTRLESEKFKNEIESFYPGAYIVRDKISLPPLDTEDESGFNFSGD